MPLSIQDLIKAVEKARVHLFITDQYYDSDFGKETYYINADILLAELKKMEE